MRTHREIISSIGVAAIAAERCLSVHTVRAWAQRDSIPADQWAWLAQEKDVSLEDLARAAARKAA